MLVACTPANVALFGKANGPKLDPIDLGARLYEYWDANTLSTLNLSGAFVNNWASRKSGLTPAQATSGFKPQYSVTGLDGFNPAVTFDGVDDFLSVEAIGGMPSAANPCEIWMVVSQISSDATVRRTFSYGGNSGNSSRQTGRNGSGRAVISSGAGAANFSAPAGDSVYVGKALTRARVENTQISLARGSISLETPVAVASATLTTRTRIGASTLNTPSAYNNVAVNRIVVCDLLSDAEASALFNYLNL